MVFREYSFVRRYPCEVEGPSIVLVGHFNPSIFHPAWFERHGLFSSAEIQAAVIGLIVPDIAQFSVGTIQFQVLAERLTISGTADTSGQIRDLAVGALTILEHTPLKMLGMNYHMHFRMPSTDEWHRVGHKLAPKEIWNGLVENPGMRGLVVVGQRSGSAAKSFRVTVEPSTQVAAGVYIGTNEHHEATEGQDSPTLVDVLQSDWDSAVRFARGLGDELLTRAIDE